jgi:hypothetical protein
LCHIGEAGKSFVTSQSDEGCGKPGTSHPMEPGLIKETRNILIYLPNKTQLIAGMETWRRLITGFLFAP